jgi:uncharacterized membrane protein
MMEFDGILGILLIAAILWALIQFINKSRSNNPNMLSQREPSADIKKEQGILKKRFTSGEISQLEYERMKKEFL